MDHSKFSKTEPHLKFLKKYVPEIFWTWNFHQLFLTFQIIISERLNKILRQKIYQKNFGMIKKTHIRNYWMNQIFLGKSGSVSHFVLSKSNFWPKISKIVRAVTEILNVTTFPGWGSTKVENWTALDARDSTLVCWTSLKNRFDSTWINIEFLGNCNRNFKLFYA